jgi:hypothetical protein
MGVLEGYALFAISVGLLACYEIMATAIGVLKRTGRLDDVILQHRFLSYVVMFCVATIAAPVMLVLIIMPSTHFILVESIVFRDK